jgi:transposase-like protein
MPWSESTKMDEKLKFVARYLDGESISDLCREFGISRVTGHKVDARYRESGLEALTDRSRRPVRFANQLPFQVEQQIVINNQRCSVPTYFKNHLPSRLPHGERLNSILMHNHSSPFA